MIPGSAGDYAISCNLSSKPIVMRRLEIPDTATGFDLLQRLSDMHLIPMQRDLNDFSIYSSSSTRKGPLVLNDRLMQSGVQDYSSVIVNYNLRGGSGGKRRKRGNESDGGT